jgi:hypothetical protein
MGREDLMEMRIDKDERADIIVLMDSVRALCDQLKNKSGDTPYHQL